MFNRQVNAVLSVIALSIFADKKVLSTEISAFVKSADIIQDKVHSDIVISETKLLLWFELNRVEIQNKMSLGAKDFKLWFQDLISELPPMRDKSFILDIVGSISNADGEHHISEKALGVMLDRAFGQSASAA